jgi:hypothetical protein
VEDNIGIKTSTRTKRDKIKSRIRRTINLKKKTPTKALPATSLRKLQTREKMSWCALKPFNVSLMNAGAVRNRTPFSIGGIGCASVINTGLWRQCCSTRLATPPFASLTTYTLPRNSLSLSLSSFVFLFRILHVDLIS